MNGTSNERAVNGMAKMPRLLSMLGMFLLLTVINGCASVGQSPQAPNDALATSRFEHQHDFDYRVDLPRGWRMVPDRNLGKWEQSLERTKKAAAGTSVSGTFRVYVLDRAFGYDGSESIWDFLSNHIAPGGHVSIPTEPFTSLKLPEGWEARVTNFRYDPGRALWVARREGKFLFLYIFAFNPTLADPAARTSSDYSSSALQNRTFVRNRKALQYIVAHTHISVNGGSGPQVATGPGSAGANDITVDEIGSCIDRAKLVGSMIMDPRDAGKSKRYVLAKIARSKLNAKEKRIMRKTAEATFDYRLDDIAVITWSIFNCTSSVRSGVDFALPLEKYGRPIQICGAVGLVARKAAVDRARGVSYKQFVSEKKRHFPGLSRENERLIWERGARDAYHNKLGRDPALVRHDAVKACLREIIESNN